MKLTTRIIYLSLIVGTIFLLRSVDIENDPEYLDIKTWTSELCSEFGSTDGQVTLATADERATASANIRSMSTNSEMKDMVQILLDNNTVDSGKLMSIIPYIAPWIAFLIFSLIGWFCYCSYCVCDKKCPPSQCCRRNFEEQPYTKKEILIPVVIGLVLNLLILGAAIAGLSVAGDVGKGMRATRCSLIAMFYDIEYSSSANQFPGLQGIIRILNGITADIDTFQSGLTNTFKDKKSVQIKTDKDALITLDTNAQRGGSSSTLPVNTGGSESYLSSNYLFDYVLAGSADPNYATYSSTFASLDSTRYKANLPATPQVDLINGYFDSLIGVTQSLETNSASITGGDFKTSLTSGVTSTQSSITSLEDAAKTLYDNTVYFGDYSSIVTAALQGLFGALLGFSIIAIVSIIMLQFMKMWKMRIPLHITWCFYCLLMILGFILAAVLHPSSVVFGEVCWYLDSYINDSAFNTKSKLISDTTTKDMISTCFFGSGNMFSQLNLESTMNDLKSVTDQITAFNTEIAKMKGGEQTRVVNAMSDNLKCFSNILDGTVIDLEPTAYDTFQSTKTAGTTATQAAIQKSSWQSSYDKEQQITDQFTTLSASFWTYMDEVSNFVTSSNAILTSITDPNVGLMGAMNCSFLKTSFQRVVDGLCVIFVPAVQKTTVIILIVSIAMFFGSLANCCIGLRFYRHKENYETDSKKVHSAKKEQGDEAELGQINNKNIN